MNPALAVWLGFLFGAVVGATLMWAAMAWAMEPIMELWRKGLIK